MSTATAPAAEHPHEEHHDHDEHVPTSDWVFVRTAIILACITAVEVGWAYLPWAEGRAWRLLEIGGLCLMMGIKFVMVAGTFMHLKFDKKVLSYLFYGGLLLAVFVYVIALSTFQFWTPTEPPYAG